MKVKTTAVLFFLLISLPLLQAEVSLASVRFETEFAIRDSVDNTGNLYIRYNSYHPSVLTFVNGDGSVTVCTSDESEKITYIYELSIDLELQRTLTFENEFEMLGAFTKDDEGNYYFFYAERHGNRNAENMAMVKYSPVGEKLNSYRLIALALNSFDGVTLPFNAGTCRLELSGSMLAVYFARGMFNGHQASYGFILDKDSFERVDRGQVNNNRRVLTGNNIMPYVSHSFNQFILPIENGFLFADHGDAYPRSFAFSKFQNGMVSQSRNAFFFPGTTGANATYAAMGALAQTSTGYIFSGAYGRVQNNPRNVFILTIDEEMSRASNPVYITDYTRDDGHAGHPKMVELDTGTYLLLWEQFSFSTQAANIVSRTPTGYVSTFMALIDEEGNLLSGIEELPGIRLNMNDVLRYNRQNGKVYWAINDTGSSITVYSMGRGS